MVAEKGLEQFTGVTGVNVHLQVLILWCHTTKATRGNYWKRSMFFLLTLPVGTGNVNTSSACDPISATKHENGKKAVWQCETSRTCVET